jgi:TRAP-type C4-dicarboxylate transport system permease small subunit
LQPADNAIMHWGSGMVRIFLDKLYLFAGYAAGGFLLAIFVLMMLLSAGRPLGLNIPAGDDLVSWCMVATSFLGLAHTFRHGEMIRVGLLIDRLEGRTRHAIEIISLLIGGFFVAFFTYYAALLTFDSWRFHDMAQGVLAMPLWVPQLGYSGGLFILLIAFIDEFVHVVCGNLPRYEKPKPQTAEEVVEQAIQSGV